MSSESPAIEGLAAAAHGCGRSCAAAGAERGRLVLDCERVPGNAGSTDLREELLAVIAEASGDLNGGGPGVLEIRTAGGSHYLRLIAAAEVIAGEPLTGNGGQTASPLGVRFGFTRKEAQVAQLLAEGRPNREIARALSVSPHTARHHIQHLMLKLGVNSRTAAAARILSHRFGAMR